VKTLALLTTLAGGLVAHPYISLSTPEIYAPGQPVEVRLEVSGTDVVHMRLYRIEDPMEFFARQENLRSPKVTEKKKPANFFHMLGGLVERPRRNSRYLAREILSEESRIALRDFFALPALEKPAETGEPARLGPSSIPRLKGYPLLREGTIRFEKKKKKDAYNDDYYYYDSDYHYKTIDLEIERAGVYLVEVYYGTRVAYTPVIVTGMSLVTKQDPHGVYVFAANTADGAPRRSVKVMVLADTNLLAAGRTDSKGLFHAAFDSTHLRILASDGADFALMDRYYYYNYYNERSGSGEIKVYLHTERPIYRPDQTVYFKGVLRRRKQGLYRTPAGEELEVTVTDPQGNELYRNTLKSDAFGAFSDSLLLPSCARLGRYTLSATAADSSYHSVQFRVEEYRKPEFKVEVETDADAYVQGDAAAVTVSADYFFGAPVADAEVTLKVYRREYADYWYYYSEFVDELSARTDAHGKAVFRYRTPKPGASYRYVFQAQVRDASRRSESGEASAFVAASGVMVSLRPERYVVAPNEPFAFVVKTRDIHENPTPGRVSVVVHHDPWEKPAKVVMRKTVSTGSAGRVRVEFVPKKVGAYYVEAEVKDERGNTSRTRRWFYVAERGGYYSWGTDDIQVIFDKESYEPGERCEALVILPYEDAHFIASLESDRIYRIETQKAAGNTALLRFKVRREFVPNVFLSIAGIHDGEFFRHEEKMKVSREEELLSVRITADKERYEPGERARLSVEVTDAKGRPVRADVSLGVVDEAIYSLASEIAPSIQDYFYGEREDRVSTYSSVYFRFWGYDRTYRLSAAASDSVVLAAYKGREEPKVRQRFRDVAYWNGLVRTDGRGRAEVEFVWPDNLTTWRATARAITMNTKVGEARQKTLVTKDLLVRITTPRFLTERDSLLVSTVVHNYTSTLETVNLSFAVEGARLLDTAPRTLSLKPGASARVDWPVRCETAGLVSFLAKAQGSTASDAMRLTIHANPHGLERNVVLSAFMHKPQQRVTKDFSIPDEAELRTLEAELTLTPTIGSALFAGLAYLAGYPYGCVEQTMSSFFPDLIVADLIRDPKRGDEKLAEELPKMIQKGLARLYGYQHTDGGWGWWEHDETMNIMTAYVVHGLTYADELGFEINPTVLERGTAALAGLLEKRSQKLTSTERAYMIYALAMAPGNHLAQIKRHLAILEKGAVDPYSRALMALTYHEIGEEAKAKAALAKLKTSALSDGETVYWSGRVRAVEHWSDDATETTATALRAFLAVSPDDKVVPKIVFWLLRQRRGSRWKSTKDSALALLALAEFLGTIKDETPEMELAFSLNGDSIAAYTVSQRDLLEFARPLKLHIPDAKHGKNVLTVTKKGAGNLFFSLVLSYYSKEENVPAGGTRLKIQREYYRLIPRVEDDRLVYDKVKLPPNATVRVGEPVFVKLYVDADDDYEYVMVTDPLPAGCEVAKNRDRYRIRNERYWWGYYDYEDWGYMYSGREIHDDHSAFFVSYLWGGWREFSYVLEPYLPGRYHVMPAEVSLMYFPDKRGHSAETILTVTER